MTSTDNVREVSFGNGYSQVASAGFHTMRKEYSIVYAGKDYYRVIDFLHRHKTKPFAWLAPDQVMGLYRVKSGSITSKPISPTAQEVTATFVEQFTSM